MITLDLPNPIRLLRLTDQAIPMNIFDSETLDDPAPTPLENATGTIQVFSDAGEEITDPLTIIYAEESPPASPVTGAHYATIEGGTPPFSTANGYGYYAKIIITAPADAVMIRRVHIVDG